MLEVVTTVRDAVKANHQKLVMGAIHQSHDARVSCLNGAVDVLNMCFEENILDDTAALDWVMFWIPHLQSGVRECLLEMLPEELPTDRLCKMFAAIRSFHTAKDDADWHQIQAAFNELFEIKDAASIVQQTSIQDFIRSYYLLLIAVNLNAAEAEFDTLISMVATKMTEEGWRSELQFCLVNRFQSYRWYDRNPQGSYGSYNCCLASYRQFCQECKMDTDDARFINVVMIYWEMIKCARMHPESVRKAPFAVDGEDIEWLRTHFPQICK